MTLTEIVQHIVHFARTNAPLEQLEKAVRAAYPLTRDLDDAARSALLASLAPAFEGATADHAVLVGYLCGAVIEDDTSPAPVQTPLLAAYVALARAAASDVDALTLLTNSPQPAMAMLSASADARGEAHELAEALAPLAHQASELEALLRLARVLDDAPYVALEPSTGRGVRGRMSGLADVGQLCTLLMGVFPGAARRVTETALRNAQGLGPLSVPETVTAAFALYGLHAAPLPAGDEHLLQNEALPADIPVFEGERVVLLAEPPFSRTWAAQRTFDMRAALTVEAELTREQVQALLTRLG